MITLRPSGPNEAVVLTDLCLRSKAVWGYDERFMQACRSGLTFTPTDLRSPYVQVAEAGKRVMGVVEITPEGRSADLAKLFVEPAALRTGTGRILFEWAKAAARATGAVALVIEADPNAVGFYRRMGAMDDGVVSSGPIPGRWLPRLVAQL